MLNIGITGSHSCQYDIRAYFFFLLETIGFTSSPWSCSNVVEWKTRLWCHSQVFKLLHLILMKLRATLHMSQESWPCNGEDPWFSCNGCTMGVGNVVLCSVLKHSVKWEWIMLRDHCIFCWQKKRGKLVWCNMSQTLSIRSNVRNILQNTANPVEQCYGSK